MDPAHFTTNEFGEVRREPGNRYSFNYFHPAPIPRELHLTTRTIRVLSDADAALGLLNGLGRLIQHPELLLGPYLRREAVASSRIEGTRATLSEVLRAEASGSAAQSEDISEVERYLEATEHAVEHIGRLPITQRLIKSAHSILLSGVRGQDKLPGELRRTPVWIGSTDDSPETAVFVPPLPAELADCLADWEDFVNAPNDLPVLVRCGLMHYQFETIHPFLDGNGRIGRLLINLLLLDTERLTHPLLYLSGYLESHREEYYKRLQAVREHGAIQEWLQFFFTAVREQSEDAVTRAGALVELRERYLRNAVRTRSNLAALVTGLFENPYVTVRRAERMIGVSNAGARNIIRDAERRGWLTELTGSGRGGRSLWLAPEILDIIEAPLGARDPVT